MVAPVGTYTEIVHLVMKFGGSVTESFLKDSLRVSEEESRLALEKLSAEGILTINQGTVSFKKADRSR